ncbi:ribonuclease T2 family protein [Candidatus Electronema sp. JM]|uniref:ribonuclease T2 family protein n=1 Tax=Candidatus Electronema sp. JM TaxID=3401571 RepID=UPI003AA7F8DE
MKSVRMACAVLAALVAAPFAAQAEPSCTVANKEKIYRLELSVPATFCRTAGGDPSCTVMPKKSLLQLHGLWPNYKSSGYPTGQCASPGECKELPAAQGKYCGYIEPKGLYDSAEWKDLSEAYMAGKEKCLERHEWVKHGTCTQMAPPEYFAWALKETKRIADALALEPDKKMSPAEFNKAVKDKLPELDGAVHIGCKGNKKNKLVSNLYVIYEWGKEPGKPVKTNSGQNAIGNCGNSFMFPSK